MTDKKILAKNKKAFFDFEILEDFEAGIMLRGYEVKSVRNGRVNLKGSYVAVLEDGVYVNAMHIGAYSYSNVKDYNPTQRRKILLNRKEIDKLIRAEKQTGITIVPLEMYLKKGLIKLRIAMVKSKKLHDKRKSLRDRAVNRDVNRVLKNFN